MNWKCFFYLIGNELEMFLDPEDLLKWLCHTMMTFLKGKDHHMSGPLFKIVLMMIFLNGKDHHMSCRGENRGPPEGDYNLLIGYCQAPSQIPNPQGPAPTQSNPVKISSKGTGADTKILWATTTTPPPPHPQLLSMKEASNKKTQRIKVI